MERFGKCSDTQFHYIAIGRPCRWKAVTRAIFEAFSRWIGNLIRNANCLEIPKPRKTNRLRKTLKRFVRKMAEELLEIKQSFGPFTLNVKELLRRIRGQKPVNRVNIVAERFLQAFEDHSVAVSQIPRFLPQLRLDQLGDTQALLAALTPQILCETAKMFGIRREWLEGKGTQLYNSFYCYKSPDLFIDELLSLKLPDHGKFPLRVLCADNRLMSTNRREQLLALVFVEQIGTLDEEDDDLCRYRICGDHWDWSYLPARIQLKAMARLVSEEFGSPISLLVVKPDVLEKVRSGQIVPGKVMSRQTLTEPCFEDFALSPTESRQAKDCEELPAVLGYMKQHDLVAQFRNHPLRAGKRNNRLRK